MLGVAVSAVVPRHHAIAGIGQQGREDVEGAGEVEAAVRQQDGLGGGVPPFVDGELHAVAIDAAPSVGPARTGMAGDGGLAHGARA